MGGGPDQVCAATMALTSEGFDVETASSAEGALRAIARHAFDLAIVDLMMSGMSAIQFARAIREQFPRTRVVLMGAYHLSERQLVLADCGAIAFVPTPFPLKELARFLREKLRAGHGPSP